MTRTCTVCAHPERHALDLLLVDGKASYRNIAERYALSLAALFRHRTDHLPATLLQAKADEEVRQALDVVAQLKAINGAALGVLRDAKAAGEGELVLKAIDRVHRQIELQAKLLGDLDERPQVSVLVSPEWVALRLRIVGALQGHPQAALALAEVLGDVG
jgi:hypothetical protein